MMKTGEAITALLVRYGVSQVFGVPGTHSLELYRGLATHPGIRHVLAHHEQGAGFMADGYARCTGRPGVCFVITGAGVTNIATPMAEAYADSVPMLVISPVNEPDGGGLNRGRLHEITDQAAVTSPFAAFSATARTVDEIPDLLARAFAVFAAERPCPVHINVPLHLLDREVREAWHPVALPAMPRVEEGELRRAAQFIAAARAPTLVVGGGARFCTASVMRLAERIDCPVITTVAGRGVVPASHPLCAGAQLRAEPVQALLAESDLALVLGTALAQPDHWNEELPLPARQIRVNIDPAALLADGDVVALKGDLADAAERLCGMVPDARGSAGSVPGRRRCARVREQLSQSMTDKRRRHWRVLEMFRDRLPDGARVFSDMTQLAYTAIGLMPLEQANSWHHPTGYGALGYGLPAALGGAVADPARPAVVIVGDAGLQYTMQELPLAAELSLDIKVLLWNNDALEQIYDDMTASGIEPLGVFQKNPDFDLLARACGWRYSRVRRLEELDPALERLFSHPGPALLQVDEQTLFRD